MQRHELLKEIAETINGAYEMETMLQDVLEKLLQVTGLSTGWVFLAKQGSPEFRCPSDTNLPPALTFDGKRPMCEGGCWCLDRFHDGRLRRAVNILNCKRIEDAEKYDWGDTEGITHHASIPLRSGEVLFGVLNVASPGKTHFTEEELALLQSIALQIGSAAHRIRLYQTEQKRANLFARLGDVTHRLGSAADLRQLEQDAVRLAGTELGWPHVALYFREEEGLTRRAAFADGVTMLQPVKLSAKHGEWIGNALEEGRTVMLPDGASRNGVSGWRSGAAVPLRTQSNPSGVLAAGHPRSDGFDAVDAAVLESLANHVALTYDSLRLLETNRELARWEERNRIARDLHDSVSQMLFSMSLHAKGLDQALPEAPDSVRAALKELQRLSQSAFAEMRAMIRQLRPLGLEEGLLTGLQTYGAQIGLQVLCSAGELRQLPDRIESALWRIGQEALNNVKKHAGTAESVVSLAYTQWEVTMKISDRGSGMSDDESVAAAGYGMSTMRERAEALGGTVAVRSGQGLGTDVIVRIPL
jgi:signal transduction histidine kinase